MDHFYQISGFGPEDAPMLEAYSTLAGIAARTSRIRVGALVTGVTYPNPALLAKTVTTLDVISERRGSLVAATPARAAEVLREYVEAGFGGFTFGNTMRPGESLDLAAELIRSFA